MKRLLKAFGTCLMFLLFLGIFVALLVPVSEWVLPELWGSTPLGNNIYLEGFRWIHVAYTDRVEGRHSIVWSVIIPDERLDTDSTSSVEIVEDANYDYDWIIVRTSGNTITHKKYYIIDKDFDPKTTEYEEVIDKHIVGFADTLEFASACRERGITMKWGGLLD